MRNLPTPPLFSMGVVLYSLSLVLAGAVWAVERQQEGANVNFPSWMLIRAGMTSSATTRG